MWTLKLVLVIAAVPVVAVGAAFVAIRAIDWARKNRARAAAMMMGDYLQQVNGGHLDGECDSIWDTFTGWLGEKADALSESSGWGAYGHDGHGSGGGGGHGSGSDSGNHCGGGDSGGVCQ